MKKNIKLSLALILMLLNCFTKAQTVFCPTTTSLAYAPNPLSLSNVTYSMNPGGVISSTSQFSVIPTNVITNYTLYTTGTNSNSAIVTTSYVAIVYWGGPIYDVSSPNSFSLGCGSTSVAVISINNAYTIPVGGPVSYTLLAPGTSSVIPYGSLSTVAVYSITTPGTWTVVVLDNTSFCATYSTINVTSNTVSPLMGNVSITHTVLSCANPSMLMQVSTVGNVSYDWSFTGTPGNLAGDNIAVTAMSQAPTATLVDIYTLTATDNNNACQTITVIPVYQNLFAPNASITAGGQIPVCSSTVVLINQSTTGIPLGTFPATNAISSILWQGPSPQPSATLSSIYTASTSGIYTMTAMDMNNGCTSTATVNVNVLSIAFAHTLTGSQASFQNMSTGTYSNTSYFWEFGDGTTSTLENPTHIYANGGAHAVKFKITNYISNCSDSTILSVNVTGVACFANSNFSMVPTATAQVWDVVPAYPWNVSAASWNWGDGNTSNSLYTSHQYSIAGMYNICLSVTVSCGDTSTSCTSYNVYRTTQEAQVLSVNVVAPELISGLKKDDMLLLSWSIAPNPNAGGFTISLQNSDSDEAHIIISDLTGRVVYDNAKSKTNASIQTNLPDGVYLLSLQTNEGRAVKRMVVIK